MKIYGLWVNDWESNDLIAVFDSFEEATRWRNYFIESLTAHAASHAPEDECEHFEGPHDYMISCMAHMARNGDLKGRLKICEHEVGCFREDIKVDNLKLLEWEAKKREETNPQSLS